MNYYWNVAIDATRGYANYFWHEISTPGWGNYFYWLIAISVLVYMLELLFPWRKNQPKIREDFWLDLFYVFFNFFLFSLVGYAAISTVGVTLFNDFLASTFGIRNLVAINLGHLPQWSQLLLLFILRDFIQWNIHVLLHKSDKLWQFHKVHHSVRQMGFAAHLRYHFMETFVYRIIEYLPLAMIGFNIQQVILVHLVAITIGHLNHANFYLPLGPLKYVFNSPQMHIWHHAEHLPEGKLSVNYGISLSVWDYLFGTVWMPKNGRDEKLGFDGVDTYPHGFFSQMLKPFKKMRH